MRVAAIGAGVVGVTTAYYLAKSGHDVIVIDRARDVADGASHANGGQLSYSFTDALAKPDFLKKIPALIAGRDLGSQMRLAPALIPWGLRFLRQCTSERARQNTLAVLKIAMRSATLLQELNTSIDIEFSHRAAGKLILLANEDELAAATASTLLKNEHGSDSVILGVDEAIGVEPALAHLAGAFAGAVYSRSDEVGDARLFTRRLKEWLEQNTSARFHLGVAVDEIVTAERQVRCIRAGGESIDVDAVVVCCGAWSGKLLRPLGLDPHIYPVRGYSVTLPLGESAPSVSVTALNKRIVFSRMNDSMRIAGFADFNGFSTTQDDARIRSMLTTAKAYAPHAANYDAKDQQHWGGFRPMTPDGIPKVGRTRLEGLFLNTGHGMLGWTLACACAYDVAASISNTNH